MTDKQIIINGIDVSGCKHYKNRNCIADYCLTDMPFSEAKCELNTNCYYKLHKRKEQECEKLKKQLFSFMNGDYCANGCSLKQQLDKLKQTLAQIKEMLKEICMEECSFDWNKTSKKHCGDCDCRYGQILQKIKQEADKVNNG